tara:strand:+ start:223 stop:534 length:312 start_codon:yes stop_codon:yes gene_type:complete
MKDLDVVDHIAIQVEDIQESLKWYINNFNCKEIYSDSTWAFIKFKNTKLALVTNDQHPAHFAILDNDVEQKTNTVTHRDGSVSKYIKDNNSNFIELITYKTEK